jgi:hypothetical protein
LGAKWFKTEWNPSKELVWASGEAFFMDFTKVDFVNAVQSLSCTTDPAKICNKEYQVN